jgi:N-acetylneuraminic acid mutarotase
MTPFTLSLAVILAAPRELPPLPAAVSSLGAIAADGYLYSYGGHAGKTHSYDTKTVLGTFHRLKLDGGTAWEALPGGPTAQGLNLAVSQGRILRVGGMQPRNEPGQPADLHSLTEAAAYDPAKKQWDKLPSLPEGRSSHDVVVAGDVAVVVGGWNQQGTSKSSTWHDTALTLDLAKPSTGWQSIPQPFKRRALTAVAVGSKVYVICGLDSEGAPVQRVDIYDLASKQWSTGPELLGEGRMGFSPAACVVGGRIVVSSSDGNVQRLSADGTKWDKLGDTTTKRMVHRIVPHGDGILLVGGASKGGNVAAIEAFSIQP